MNPSLLRQVLTLFETASTPLSLPQMAHALSVSPQRLEGMLEYWVRKGKIRQSGATMACGSCHGQGACPFMLHLPRSFELVGPADAIPLPVMGAPCGHTPQPDKRVA